MSLSEVSADSFRPALGLELFSSTASRHDPQAPRPRHIYPPPRWHPGPDSLPTRGTHAAGLAPCLATPGPSLGGLPYWRTRQSAGPGSPSGIYFGRGLATAFAMGGVHRQARQESPPSWADASSSTRIAADRLSRRVPCQHLGHVPVLLPGGARASGAGSARHNCTHDLGLSCIFSAAEVRARLYPLELLRETLDEPLVLVDKRWTESRAPMPNIRPAACGNWLLDQCDSATRAARHDTFLCPVSFRILADPRCAVSSCIRNSRLAIDRLRHRPVDQTSRVLVSPTTPRAVQSGSMLSRA